MDMSKVKRVVTVNRDEVGRVINYALDQVAGDDAKALTILIWATAELTRHSKTPINRVAKAVKNYHKFYDPIGELVKPHQPAPKAVQ
jgi:hypothetical protein